MNQERAQSVIDFWFKELRAEQWFKKDQRLDKDIKDRFEELWASTKDADLDELLVTPQIALAAVIVLDQFPRNMFRGTLKAFSSDKKALSLSEAGIERGMDKKLSQVERMFFYMPFQHSENIDVQNRSLDLFLALGDETAYSFAKDHHRIIKMFGRFPHRNEILGRSTTEAEKEFMKEHPGF